MRKVYAFALGFVFVLTFIFGGTTAYAEDPAMDVRRARCEDKEPGDTCEFQGEEGLCATGYAGGARRAACTGDPEGLDGFFDDAGTSGFLRLALRESVDKRQACDNGEDIGTECSYKNLTNPAVDEVDGICARGDGSTENNETNLLTEGRLFCHVDHNIEDSDWDCQDYSQAGDRCYSVEFDEVGRCESDGEESLTCNTEHGDREPGEPYIDCDGVECDESQVCVSYEDNVFCADTATCGGGCSGDTICVEDPDDPNNSVCADEAGEEKTVPDTPGAGDGDGGGGFTRREPEDITFRNPIAFETIPELLAGLIRSALGLLAAVTTVILVISGFKYMVAGSPSGVQSALGGIKNAVIGLVIIMGSFLLTEYVISALLS